MVVLHALTIKEKQVILFLFKEFTNLYSASDVARKLDLSNFGAQKLCKRLLSQNVLISSLVGRSIIYRINIENKFVQKLIIYLLAEESERLKLWKDEFSSFYKKDTVILFFGSAVKNYSTASDIDILVIAPKGRFRHLSKAYKEKEQILPKKLHLLRMSYEKFAETVKRKDRVLTDIVKNAIVLFGHEKYVELIKNVTFI